MKQKLLAIIGVILVVLAVFMVGNLDHDEYIEVNSTKQSRMPFWYEN